MAQSAQTHTTIKDNDVNEDSDENKNDKNRSSEQQPSSDGWGEYPIDTVFVRNETRTVADVVKRINNNRYKLDPEFQRDFVWSPLQQEKLIESCLMRIPLPVLYVAEDIDGRIIVVDGLQRLTTFHRFLEDKFALKSIEKNNPDSVVNNKTFSQLPIHLQERIEDTQLILYILDAKAPERAKLDIFERVNSGEPLTRQQMRNCIYSGPATRWLKKAAANKYFLKLTDNSLDTKSMQDKECVNHFCAFYLLGYQNYNGDIEEFLGLALTKMNTMSQAELDEMLVTFNKTMTITNQIIKRKIRKNLLFNILSPHVNLNILIPIITTTAKAPTAYKHRYKKRWESRIANLNSSKEFSSFTLFGDDSKHNTNYFHTIFEKVLISELDKPVEQILEENLYFDFFKR